MEWSIDEVTEESPSGGLEFQVKAEEEGDFFPTSVEFESTETFLKTNVELVKEGDA